MCIGGSDPTTLITPNKAMSFKYFRPTLRKVTTTQKAPAFKNTASAERFADLIDASDILTNHSVEKHLSEVNFDDHGHSILKESGLTRGHSIIETSFGDQLAGRDSILGGAGKQNEPQFGEDGARAAGEFGKGMAASDGDEPQIVVENSDGTTKTAPADEPITANESDLVDFFEKLFGLARAGNSALSGKLPGPAIGKVCVDAITTPIVKMNDTKNVIIRAMPGTAWDPKHPVNNSNRPGPDDNGGGEGGFMTWKLQDQLSKGPKGVKDPITNPNTDDLGGDYLNSPFRPNETDPRNAKDPCTNWGDDYFNSLVATKEMDRGAVSLKETCTNWGDNYTSTTADVVDTVFAVQDVF